MANAVTLRCTKDGTNYNYTGTDTQPSYGKYLKYTNGNKTGYLYLNPTSKGYVAELNNGKKLKVNDYYVEVSFHETVPIYYFASVLYATWASKNSGYDNGYIRRVKPKMVMGMSSHNELVGLYNDKPLVNLYHPATNSLTMDVIFAMPYTSSITKSFTINCRKESLNGMISPDDYFLPTTNQYYMARNYTYGCYYAAYNSAEYPSLYHRGIYFRYADCPKTIYTWYRTAEG